MANTLCSNRHILVAPESSRIHYFYGKLSQVKNLLIVLKITSPTARFCKVLVLISKIKILTISYLCDFTEKII
jgi:hypothetical protein